MVNTFELPLLLLFGANFLQFVFTQQHHLNQTSTMRPNFLETGRQITGILDKIINVGYDKRVRPNYGGPPIEVNVTMRILSISSVSEVMMDFTADFYFRQTWHDPRLSFKRLGDIHTLYVGAEVSKKIWLPDTFFGNEKMAYFHEATTPNVFLRIDHSGEVYRSIRLTVTSSCPMNLQYFPMDKQRCTIEAESYGYNFKDIRYRWARQDTAVERDKEISLPQFDIVRTVQKYRLEELSSEIHFARRMGYYLIQIYIPSSLIVVISWVSFWLHRNASPARVQLGVTTVLTMTTLMSSTNAALPKISYVKSIDIFLGTCFIMVFAALLEYATVGYLGKRIAMRKAHVQHAQSQAQARAFAQLQAQGAQGDPVSFADTALLHQVSPSLTATQITHQQSSTINPLSLTHSKSQPYLPVCDQCSVLEVAPQAPERSHRCHFQARYNCNPLSNGTPVSWRAQNSCCCQANTSHHSHRTKHKTYATGCRCHHHNSHKLPRNPTSTDTDELEVDKSHQKTQSCNSSEHQESSKWPPSYCDRASAAAAAAAATFVNLHRKNKGLPPSNNPNFAQFSWMGMQNPSLETIFGVRPSDIDKYSRVVFPVCFVCFQLMYWIVYLHISAFLESEQQHPTT